MPRGDGTGPLGRGSKTGRGMGFCKGYNSPGFVNPGFRRGFGRMSKVNPRGIIRPRFAQQIPSKDQEKQMLENELTQLEAQEDEIKNEKESIKKKLEELGN